MNTDFNILTKDAAKNLAFDTLVEVKDVTFSTIDKDGNPASRIADIMLRDEDTLYFMTCNVKPFYFELKNHNHVAVTALTKDFLMIRLKAQIKELSLEKLDEIYEKNPSLADLFRVSSETGNAAVFCLEKGKGEVFDLSGEKVKVQRARFDFGGERVNEAGCMITEACINCGKCIKVCPFGAITQGKNSHEISQTFCDECGMCYYACPVKAIELPVGM